MPLVGHHGHLHYKLTNNDTSDAYTSDNDTRLTVIINSIPKFIHTLLNRIMTFPTWYHTKDLLLKCKKGFTSIWHSNIFTIKQNMKVYDDIIK